MRLSAVSHQDCPNGCDQGKLMVSGLIRLKRDGDQPVEVSRGMSIRANDGEEVGKVAAVLVKDNSEQASHILLGRLPQEPGYFCVPVDLIKKVEADSIFLLIPNQGVNNLPAWCSDI